MRNLVWAATAAALAFASPAGAAILTATYTGHVEGTGFDTLGLFGDDLDGTSFTAVFRYDTSKGQRVLSPGVEEDLLGCTDAASISCALTATQPLISASVTLGGVTDVLTGPFLFSSVYSQAGVSTYHDMWFEFAGGGRAYYEFQMFHDAPASVDATFDLDTPDVDHFANSSQVSYTDGSGGSLLFYLRSEHLTISAAPEPGAWALMILGFGLAGAALRRRPALAAIPVKRG